MNQSRAVYWSEPAPASCNLCDDPIRNEFADAVTPPLGMRWTIVCPACFRDRDHLIRFGVGCGQRYVRQADDGRFMKVEG